MLTIRDELIAARERTPEVFHDAEPADWKRVADAAVDGVVLFYGDTPVRVGRRGIDWSGGHVAHQEWVAQLNRFGWIDALRWAFVKTGRGEYAEAARDYIEDWLDARQPYAPADGLRPVPGESSLNLAVRLGGTRHVGWLASMADLLASDAFDEAFAERVVDSIVWQLDWVMANLAPKNNWRVASLDAVFSQGLRLPGRLDGNLAAAVDGLNTEFAAQVLADGCHAERSGGYHDWMAGVFVTLWRIGRRRPEIGLDLDGGSVTGMDAYALHHLKPNGGLCGFNDAHASFRTTEASAAKVADKLDAHRVLLAEAGLPTDVPTAGFFTAAGHVFYRTGWGPDDLWWAFDAGGWDGGHGHLSRLSIELHNGRRTTLPDPGIFDYEMSNPFAAAGKSTAAHSTLNVALGNQADVDAALIRAVERPAAIVVQGRYEGAYWPGTFGWRFDRGRGRGWFGSHDRTVVWLRDRAMVVLDSLAHDGDSPVYLHWVSDDVPADLDAERLRLTTGDPAGNVRIQVCPIADETVAMGLHRGERGPFLGWVGERHGEPRPAPLLQCRFDAPASGGTRVTECATVIAPFDGADAPEFTVTAAVARPDVRQVDLRWADGRRDRIIYTARLAQPIRRFEDVRSRARLLIVSRDGGSESRTEID